MNLLTNAPEAMPKGGQVRLEKLSSTTACSIARWRTSPSRATRQEMRRRGQCHVEYHVKGPDKHLVYPWSKWLKVEEILAYYDETIQGLDTRGTEAPALKAQHPEFEM